MDQVLRSPALIGLLVLSVIVYFGNQRYKPKYDPKEPLVLPQKLPYIGHVISLLWYGLSYYKDLSAQHKLPIYTLQMLNTKVYVINVPDVVVAVRRNSKNLLFSPILPGMIPRFFGVDKDIIHSTAKTMQDEGGEWINAHPLYMANYVQLLPGPNLDIIIRKMQTALSPLMDQLREQTKSDEDAVIGLYAWIKNSSGLASTDAFYGQENPFKLQPKLINALWEMSDNLTSLLLPVVPWLTARKAYEGRQRVVDALNRYFASNWREDASELIKARYDAFQKASTPIDVIARYEMGNSLAIMINTAPAIFWVLNFVYLDSKLLEELRTEIAASALMTTSEQTGTKVHHLDFKGLQKECKLLMSTYQEVLRLQSDNVSSQLIFKDAMINDQYLLRKNSVVQIPGAVIHQDPAVWGPDVKKFNPGRFLKGAEKHHPGAYRVLGGFATAELISFVAIFIMRFDLVPVNYGWRKPLAAKGSLVDAIPSPTADIDVHVKMRKEFENDEWVFDASA